MASSLVRLTRVSATACSRLFVSRKSRFHTTVTTRKSEKEDMDDLQKNPYYAKYAGKIAQLQKTSPEEFLNRLADVEKSRRSGAAASSSADGGEQGKDFSLPTQPKASKSDVAMTKEKKLSDRMKVELLMDKSKEEIAEIWRQYYSDKDAVSAVIPADMFKQMQARFETYKTFLFPLPRKQGYEFVVVQFQGNEAHFTTLINYQAYSENAPECLTLVHYTELAEEKGIVLMVGEYDTNVLTTQEAQCLANQVEMYYCNPEEDKIQLLETFAKRPAEFKHQDLIANIENISLNAATAAATLDK